MTILEMFEQSGILALLGMGIVFSFLIVLVVFVSATAKVVKLMKWDRDIWPSAAATASGESGAVPAEIAAAISTAVHEHIKRNS